MDNKRKAIRKEDLPDLVPRKMGMDYLNCSSFKFYHLCRRGSLRPYMIDGKMYFRREEFLEDVDALLDPIHRNVSGALESRIIPDRG